MKCDICGRWPANKIDRARYCEAHQHIAGDQAILDVLGSRTNSIARIQIKLQRRGWALNQLRPTLERMLNEGFLVRVSANKTRHSHIRRRVKSVTYWRAA
jgi:hypothetical protein